MREPERPLITREEINKSKDAVMVACPVCGFVIAYLTTLPDNNQHLKQKLFSKGGFYSHCPCCHTPLDWDVV